MAKLEHHPVTFHHLFRGHTQRAERVIDVRVSTGLIDDQVGPEHFDHVERVVQRLPVEREVLCHPLHRPADAPFAAAHPEGRPVDGEVEQVR